MNEEVQVRIIDAAKDFLIVDLTILGVGDKSTISLEDRSKIITLMHAFFSYREKEGMEVKILYDDEGITCPVASLFPPQVLWPGGKSLIAETMAQTLINWVRLAVNL